MKEFKLACSLCSIFRQLKLLQKSRYLTIEVPVETQNDNSTKLKILNDYYVLSEIDEHVSGLSKNNSKKTNITLEMAPIDEVEDALVIDSHYDKISEQDEYFLLKNGTILSISVNKNSISCIRTIRFTDIGMSYMLEVITVDGSNYPINGVDNVWMALMSGFEGATKQIYSVQSHNCPESIWISRYKNKTEVAIALFFPSERKNVLEFINSTIRHELYRFQNSKTATLVTISNGRVVESQDIKFSNVDICLTSKTGDEIKLTRNQSGTKVSFK